MIRIDSDGVHILGPATPRLQSWWLTGEVRTSTAGVPRLDSFGRSPYYRYGASPRWKRPDVPKGE